MITNKLCEELLAIAGRLHRMPLASHRDPERPHRERSEIVRAIEMLAFGNVDPRNPTAIAADRIAVREISGRQRMAVVDAKLLRFVDTSRA